MIKAFNILLLLLFLTTQSCQKNKGDDSSNYVTNTSDCITRYTVIPLGVPVDTTGAAVQIDSLPLSAGNKWTYSVSEQAYNICGAIYEDAFSFTIIIDSIMVRNGMRFAHVSTTYNPAMPGTADYFSVIFFCSPGPSCYLINLGNGLHQLNSLASTDSGYVADSSAYLLDAIGASWSSKEAITLTSQSLVMRQWAGYVKVTTPAGVFNCEKMTVTDNSDFQTGLNILSMTTSQYYSTKGLVQEVQQGEGTNVAPGTGPVTVTRVITLTAVNF